MILQGRRTSASAGDVRLPSPHWKLDEQPPLQRAMRRSRRAACDDGQPRQCRVPSDPRSSEPKAPNRRCGSREREPRTRRGLGSGATVQRPPPPPICSKRNGYLQQKNITFWGVEDRDFQYLLIQEPGPGVVRTLSRPVLFAPLLFADRALVADDRVRRAYQDVRRIGC